MPVRRPGALTKLITTFAHAYPDIRDARMLVLRADLDATMIAFDARSFVNWNRIVSFALLHDGLDALVAESGDADLNPGLLPDMQNLVAEYRKWASDNGVTAADLEDVAAQAPPGVFDRYGKTILYCTIIALIGLALCGAIARTATHIFLGIPGAPTFDLFREPLLSAGEGWALLQQTLVVGWRYAITENQAGAFLTAMVVGGIVLLGRRLPRIRRRFITPAVVVPLLIAGAAAKMLWYDAPATAYANVLVRDYHPESLIVPPIFTSPARARWQSIICSRMAGSAHADVCGNSDRFTYQQNVDGSYLLDSCFTALLCTWGILAMRKVLLPYRHNVWNLSRRRKWRAAIGIAIALLLALLPLPSTYARTVRSTTYSYVCLPNDVDCYFPFRVDEQFYRYMPREFTTTIVPPSATTRPEDILAKALETPVQTIDAPL
jgi:hypothetical protein